MNGKKYIYNHVFASWLIQGGAKVIDAGVGNKGDNFIVFEWSELFQELCDKWNPKNKTDK